MESATITKVTLRQEKLRSGKLSLYLDFYAPIWNPHIKKMSRREFLGLYLIGNPKNKFELDYNEEIMLKARGIRATRELAIINEVFGFLDRTKKHADLLSYFEAKTKVKYQKWEIVYKHFKDFLLKSGVAKKLNLRPRKKLGFSIPKNEFFKQIANFALAS